MNGLTVKFEFSDRQEFLVLPLAPPLKGDLVRIHSDNGEIVEYIVESITYNFQDLRGGDCIRNPALEGMLVGCGYDTVVAKCKINGKLPF